VGGETGRRGREDLEMEEEKEMGRTDRGRKQEKGFGLGMDGRVRWFRRNLSREMANPNNATKLANTKT
jgi:hypothetical protein